MIPNPDLFFFSLYKLMKGVTPSPHETSTLNSIGNLILLSKIQDKVTVALLEVDHDIFYRTYLSILNYAEFRSISIV